ncbi:MAG: universal stress protein [Thaumarchaeota archaeon]|nr:universal stress protein [Nitrososphaerota archaeon]
MEGAIMDKGDLAKILVPIDGSPTSAKAEKMAIKIARAFDSELVFVHVIPTSLHLMPNHDYNVAFEIKNWGNTSVEDEKIAKTYLLNALEGAKRAETKASARLYRTTFSVRAAISKVAKDIGVDLIVIGTRGTSVGRVIMGSVTTGVVTSAECPVLVVR